MDRSEVGSVYSQLDFYFINLGSVKLSGFPRFGKQMSCYTMSYQISPYVNHWLMIPKESLNKSIKKYSEEELIELIKNVIKDSLYIKQKAVVINDSLYATYHIIEGIRYLVTEFTGRATAITSLNLLNKVIDVNFDDYTLRLCLNNE